MFVSIESTMVHRFSFLWFLLALAAAFGARAAEAPLEVSFLSRDGHTVLRGYVYTPTVPGPWPAVVMMHGRSGPYSSLAKGVYEGSTLSLRHKQWGRFWAERGYLALHVDSFGPRGYPQGFPIHSYSRRPAEVSEQTVRPLDAYGALDYLRSRDDVVKDRIGLHGWSNGAMAGLATIDANAPWSNDPTRPARFRAALLFYPSCLVQAATAYRPTAPTLMFIGSEDEEVAPRPCRELTEQVRSRGGSELEVTWYEGATHNFDNPAKGRQSVAANRAARADSMRRAEAFFLRHLKEQDAPRAH